MGRGSLSPRVSSVGRLAHADRDPRGIYSRVLGGGCGANARSDAPTTVIAEFHMR